MKTSSPPWSSDSSGQAEAERTKTTRVTYLGTASHLIRDLLRRQRLAATSVLRKSTAVVPRSDGSCARMNPSLGIESAGGSSESSMASPPRRGLEPTMNFEDYLGLHGRTPLELIGLVDAHFHPGGRSWDETADQTEGSPTNDVDSMRPAILRAHLRGTCTSAVGVPRGVMGPLSAVNMSLACKSLLVM